ncbi:MAG: hypothetical protein AAB421_03755 [Patescibacteria group bacterium]
MWRFFRRKDNICAPVLFAGAVAELGQFKPITPNLLNDVPALGKAIQSADLGQFLNAAFIITISAGAILAVMRIGYAGFLYMTTDVFTQKSQAKTIIRDAVLGLILLLGIVLILSRINPQILKINTFLPGSTAPGADTSTNTFMGRVLGP